MRFASVTIAALAAGALAVAGCGGDDDGAGGGTKTVARQATSSAKAASGVVKLSETEFKITPADPSVAKAGKVTFIASNDGQAVHALEVEGPAGEARTGSIAPGRSARLQVELTKPGTYELYCPIDGHKQRGMKGEVKVASGGATSGDSGSASSSGGGGGGY
jgi:uncharacterized cupredoxin-like copper-binding protein